MLTSLFVVRNPVLGFIVNAMKKRVIKILFESHPLIKISGLEAAKGIGTFPVMSMMSISTLYTSQMSAMPHIHSNYRQDHTNTKLHVVGGAPFAPPCSKRTGVLFVGA